MKLRELISIICALALALISVGCGTTASLGETPIKSVKSGDLTVTLASQNGEIRNGENDLLLSFTDQAGNTVDVGAASLTFHMPAMGSMGEMNNSGTLTTTEVAGKYRARVDIEMAGSWEAVVLYQGPHGEGQARMSVNVK